MKNDIRNRDAAKAADEAMETVATAVPVEEPAPVIELKAETLAAEASVRAEAARGRATQLISERRYAEAKSALAEAEALENPDSVREPSPKVQHRVMTQVRYQLQRLPKPFKRTDEAAQPAEKDAVAALAAMEPEDRAVAIVGLYSKIAVVAGLMPGGLLNYAAILAVQVTMVWRIANTFGKGESKARIRGVILAMLGSAVPTAVGGTTMLGTRAALIHSTSAFLASTLAAFVVTPVFAYAMTKAVGSVFVMHFESGGTLLDFDPKAFREYFIKEFQEAGGTVAAPAAN